MLTARQQPNGCQSSKPLQASERKFVKGVPCIKFIEPHAFIPILIFSKKQFYDISVSLYVPVAEGRCLNDMGFPDRSQLPLVFVFQFNNREVTKFEMLDIINHIEVLVQYRHIKVKQFMSVLLSTISVSTILILMACNGSSNNKSINEQMRSENESITHPAKNISVSINKPVFEVYQFASNPENFPKWVAFVESIKRQDSIWIGESSLGVIKIKFAPQNDFGIIDHQVTLPSGETVNNPMRVIANAKGCEFIFTLFWLPGRTEQEFSEDAKAVTSDLQKLKEILESN